MYTTVCNENFIWFIFYIYFGSVTGVITPLSSILHCGGQFNRWRKTRVPEKKIDLLDVTVKPVLRGHLWEK